MKLRAKQEKQAQIVVPKALVRVENISLTLMKNIQVNASNNCGCTFLSDNKCAIASHNSNAVIVLNESRFEDFRIDTSPYNVIDIVYVPSINSIATTTGMENEHRINFIDITTRTISMSIPVNSESYGITLYGNKHTYCARERVFE